MENNPEQTSLTKKVRFLGSSAYTLSDDGRIVLPKEFREKLKDFAPYYLCAGFYEKCLWLLPAEVYYRILDNLNQKISLTDRAGQEFLRIASSYAVEITHLGNLGRIVIPQRLREWAGLKDAKTPVEIIGVVDRVEIWNKKTRSERESAQDMEQLSQQIYERYQI